MNGVQVAGVVAAGVLALLGTSTACVAKERPAHVSIPWPTTAWSVSTPEAQGMSSADLADGLEFALTNGINVHSITVVRRGHIVLDAYFYPFARDTRHDVASVTKSVVSQLIGIAIQRGDLSGPDQPLVTALSKQHASGVDDAVARIRLSDLLSMRSGFDCGFKHGEVELNEMRSAKDWTARALQMPVIDEPGKHFGYCSPNYHLLSAAISSSTHTSALELARKHLFEPLGVTDVYWPADAHGITHGWGDLQLRPRDMAKLGLLMLYGGQWEDRQILPKSWVEQSVKKKFWANDSNDYGLGWWMPHALPGLFEATGRGGQRISMFAEKEVIFVSTGGGFEPYDIGQFVAASLRSDEPLPEDPAGQQRLAEVLRRIAAAPSPRGAADPTAPIALSGRVYALEQNPLGIRTFAVDFADPANTALRLELDNGTQLVQPLGMNGQYRLTTVNDAALSGGRAEWFEDGRLRIDFNRLSRINRFIMDAVMTDQALQLIVSEPTEFGTLRIRGTARK